jgi:hypothetical protein
MAKKLVLIVIALLLGGGVFTVVKQRGKVVKVSDELADGAQVTPETTVDMRGPHDMKPAKVEHVEMAVPDVPDEPTGLAPTGGSVTDEGGEFG